MFAVAIFGMLAGGWLIDSAIHKRNPITSALDVVRDPTNARQTIENSKNTAYKVEHTTYADNVNGSGSVNAATGATGVDNGYAAPGSGANSGRTDGRAEGSSGSDNLNGSNNSGSKTAGAIAYARAQIGKGYSQVNRYGPVTYDCSGLMFKAYQSVGIKLGTWTGEQQFNGKAIRKEDIRPGDLVFPSAGHVGIATTSGWPCNFIDAPTWGKKISERKVWSFYKARRVV